MSSLAWEHFRIIIMMIIQIKQKTQQEVYRLILFSRTLKITEKQKNTIIDLFCLKQSMLGVKNIICITQSIPNMGCIHMGQNME